MSRSINFVSKSISGYGTHDGIYHPPSSGVTRKAISISPNYSNMGDYTLISNAKFLSLRCHSRHSSVCNASSSYYRRNNPDFPKQNKNGFSRNRNRPNEEINGYEDLDESDGFLTSKNGPFLGNRKFQTTASPGAREKEIVEIFRKVQAQLHERSAVKEVKKKIESSQGKNKESETVDSLLKLLRKHSIQQGSKKDNGVNDRDFVLDQPEKVESLTEESVMVKDAMQESPRSNLSRPKSNFSRRSPVPEIKFQPVYTHVDSVDSVEHDNLDRGGKGISLESETDDIDEPIFSEGNVFDEMSEDEISENDESEHENGENEHDSVEVSDVISGMKMVELRALAKSRGMKGFSKLKKNELIELLSGSSI